MPREYVYTDYLSNDSGESVAPQMVVSIGWSRDGEYVQLATIRNGSEGSFLENDGLYTTLNRSQINDVIRKLRRARDQAYGRDE